MPECLEASSARSQFVLVSFSFIDPEPANSWYNSGLLSIGYPGFVSRVDSGPWSPFVVD